MKCPVTAHRLALNTVLAIALLSSGCSMLFMRRPPKGEGPVARGDCTRSLVAPVIDGLVGWGHFGQAAGVWGESRDAFDSDDAYDGYRVGSAIIAGSFIVSQVHGALWSIDCRRRNTLSEQAIRDHLRILAAPGQAPGQAPYRRSSTQ